MGVTRIRYLLNQWRLHSEALATLYEVREKQKPPPPPEPSKDERDGKDVQGDQKSAED